MLYVSMYTVYLSCLFTSKPPQSQLKIAVRDDLKLVNTCQKLAVREPLQILLLLLLGHTTVLRMPSLPPAPSSHPITTTAIAISATPCRCRCSYPSLPFLSSPQAPSLPMCPLIPSLLLQFVFWHSTVVFTINIVSAAASGSACYFCHCY